MHGNSKTVLKSRKASPETYLTIDVESATLFKTAFAAYLLVDLGDGLAKRVEGGHDHLVPEGLRDEHDVLVDHGLEGERVELELVHGL